MAFKRLKGRIALSLALCATLCACLPNSETPDQTVPEPQLVHLRIPTSLLIDVQQPVARGDTEGDAAILIEEQRAAIAGVNDRLYAARRIQMCHARLAAGEVETC